MDKLLKLSAEELNLVINNTAQKLQIPAALVEKDLWICVLLDYLFKEFKYRDFITFKGGTALSKVHKIIERFSEDIDLVID